MEKVIINEKNQNKRLDVFVSEYDSSLSRSYVKKLVQNGDILVNKKSAKCSQKLNIGDSIEINCPPPETLEVKAENIKLDILYEDDDVLVINKPKGMVVHPGAGNNTGTLVNAILAHCGNSLSGINGVIRPGIVHRIDKDTSGILVVAKNDNAHIKLSQQLKEHSMTRKYIAIVHGVIPYDEGKIDAPIGRDTVSRVKMSVTEKNAKSAITNFRVLERYEKYTMIEAVLQTGRTHQIRVHLSHIGYPLVGDTLYGGKKDLLKTGQALFAKTLGFVHPVTNKYMEFQIPEPDWFCKLKETITKNN